MQNKIILSWSLQHPVEQLAANTGASPSRYVGRAARLHGQRWCGLKCIHVHNDYFLKAKTSMQMYSKLDVIGVKVC